MDPRKVIIDTDPGIDDALAILLALASPEITLEALTIVHGNCSTQQGVQNALSILELAGMPDVPVAAGAIQPLVNKLILAPETHGMHGLGYAQLPPPTIKPSRGNAVELIIKKLMDSPGEIDLVAVGPLTNLALAVRLEPRLAQAVRHVYIMGGAIHHPGNTTPLAEFNTYADPHAAHIVYHAGWPITLLPLDVTYKVILTQADVARLLSPRTPVGGFIAEATRFYMEFHDEYQQIEGCVINDPLALAVSYLPQFITTQTLFVDVDISTGPSTGKTYADIYHMTGSQPNMQVALEVHARDFIDFFIRRMMNFPPRS